MSGEEHNVQAAPEQSRAAEIDVPVSPPVPVPRPVMIQDWDHLAFLHWRVDPEVMRRLVPGRLEIDTYDGSAWIGLVPFWMRIRVGPVPPTPYASIFPETNVRTYVIGPDGRRGVWFFSLDVPRAAAVAVARLTYSLPYMWSDMRFALDEDRVYYQCRRRWPERRPVASRLVLKIGQPFADDELGTLDHFLTARWGLWTRTLRGLAYAPVAHPPWQLVHAEVLDLDDSLVRAAGVTVADEPALVHYSHRQHTRIGLPRHVASRTYGGNE